MVLQSLEDMELPKESPKAFRASPGRAQAKQPMGVGPKMSQLRLDVCGCLRMSAGLFDQGPGVSALKVTKFCKDLQHFLGPLPGQ